MTVNDRADLLSTFLIENNAWNQYYSNIDKECKMNGSDTSYTIVAFCNGDDPSVCLSAAFTWVDSPEGVDFWGELCDKWTAKFKKVI